MRPPTIAHEVHHEDLARRVVSAVTGYKCERRDPTDGETWDACMIHPNGEGIGALEVTSAVIQEARKLDAALDKSNQVPCTELTLSWRIWLTGPVDARRVFRDAPKHLMEMERRGETIANPELYAHGDRYPPDKTLDALLELKVAFGIGAPPDQYGDGSPVLQILPPGGRGIVDPREIIEAVQPAVDHKLKGKRQLLDARNAGRNPLHLWVQLRGDYFLAGLALQRGLLPTEAIEVAGWLDRLWVAGLYANRLVVMSQRGGNWTHDMTAQVDFDSLR